MVSEEKKPVQTAEKSLQIDVSELVTKGFPKDLTDACLKDEKCKKKLLERYTKALEVGQLVKSESKEMEKVADICLKDEKGCREKAVKKYLNFLDARTSKEVMSSVNIGVGIGKTIIMLAITIAILWAIYIFIRTVLDPTYIQQLMDQLTNAISHMFDGIKP